MAWELILSIAPYGETTLLTLFAPPYGATTPPEEIPMKILNNILTAYAISPQDAPSTFVWGRNRFLLTYDSCTREITVLDAVTYDVVSESSDIKTLTHAIHTHRR